MNRYVSIFSRKFNRNLHQKLHGNQGILFCRHMNTDPYHVLGINPDATSTTVKSAYIRLSKQYHPDRNPGNEEAKQTFINVQNAYRTIMEKFASVFEGDEKEKVMPYDFTITPLSVENEPQPTYRDRLRHFILYTVFVLSVMVLFSSDNINPILDALYQQWKNVMKVDDETMIRRIHRQTLQEDRELKEVEDCGAELNQSWNNYKVSFRNNKS
uniref:J domain-containing protein n=1 Tax=Ciona savignyi TaxID=51511 RepID=H2Z9L3_CIOSA